MENKKSAGRPIGSEKSKQINVRVPLTMLENINEHEILKYTSFSAETLKMWDERLKNLQNGTA